MNQLVFFLEEPSAREMLKGLLPTLLPDEVIPRFVVFEGKQDLEKQLLRKLRGWRTPNTYFAVLRDKDSEDCEEVKMRLAHICDTAGKPDTLIRIVCRELESWYLGDLQAVEKGLDITGLAAKQNKRKYRDPDRLTNPTQELRTLTSNSYQKVAGSRSIGPCLAVDSNRSVSFNNFVSGVKRVVDSMNDKNLVVA